MWINDAGQVNALVGLENIFKMSHAQLKLIGSNLGGQPPILK